MFAALSSTTTPAELAARCNVDVELARDWLDGLVLARLVDHDGHRGTYTLEPDARVALAIVELIVIDDDNVIAASRLGPSALDTLRARYASMAPGMSLSVVELRAAERVADNIDHPLGPALYAASLTRRASGGAGILGEARLRALMTLAGFVDVDSRNIEPFHVVVSGVRAAL
jgi:hypothetical protein